MTARCCPCRAPFSQSRLRGGIVAALLSEGSAVDVGGTLWIRGPWRGGEQRREAAVAVLEGMWQPRRPPQEMATEPAHRAKSAEAERLPHGVQLDEPPSPAAAAEETEDDGGGGRAPLFNGCVPLSHQVAGHMFGKDKGGKSATACEGKE